MTAAVFLLCCTLYVTVQPAQSLQCYQCTAGVGTTTDLGCQVFDPKFMNVDKHKHGCPADKAECYVLRYEHDGKRETYRNCIAPADAKSNACAAAKNLHKAGAPDKEITCTSCKKDLCNNGQSLAASVMLLTVSALVLLFK